MNTHVEDLNLARRAAQGDESALRTVLERCGDPLFAWLLHTTGLEREAVEDIWQAALEAGWNALAGYRGESSLFTWWCGIARRKAMDVLRRRGKADLLLEDAVWENLADDRDGPERAVIRRAENRRVVETLMALPEDYRTALVARYAEQNSVDVVAQRLGRSYKAAESLLTRARQAFQELFRAAKGE